VLDENLNESLCNARLKQLLNDVLFWVSDKNIDISLTGNTEILTETETDKLCFAAKYRRKVLKHSEEAEHFFAQE